MQWVDKYGEKKKALADNPCRYIWLAHAQLPWLILYSKVPKGSLFWKVSTYLPTLIDNLYIMQSTGHITNRASWPSLQVIMIQRQHLVGIYVYTHTHRLGRLGLADITSSMLHDAGDNQQYNSWTNDIR